MSGWELWLAGLYAFVFVCAFGGLAGYAALVLMYSWDGWAQAQADRWAGLERWEA